MPCVQTTCAACHVQVHVHTMPDGDGPATAYHVAIGPDQRLRAEQCVDNDGPLVWATVFRCEGIPLAQLAPEVVNAPEVAYLMGRATGRIPATVPVDERF